MNTRVIGIDGLILCVGLLISGCASSQYVSTDASRARQFFEQPTKIQMQSFRQHPLDVQLDLFFFGNQVRHPPAMHLSRCFALSGKVGVDLLRSKLLEASTSLILRDISMLLLEIDRMGTYDVAGDKKLIDAIKASVATMNDSDWRDTVTKNIASFGAQREQRVGHAPECGN